MTSALCEQLLQLDLAEPKTPPVKHSHGKWQSPQEFRLMNRIKSTSLATKSTELINVTTKDKLYNEDSEEVQEAIALVTALSLKEQAELKEQEENKENKSQTLGEEEQDQPLDAKDLIENALIERGPIHGGFNMTRQGYTPYAAQQIQRLNNRMSNNVVSIQAQHVQQVTNNRRQTPAEFFQTQRQRTGLANVTLRPAQAFLTPDLTATDGYLYHQQQDGHVTNGHRPYTGNDYEYESITGDYENHAGGRLCYEEVNGNLCENYSPVESNSPHMFIERGPAHHGYNSSPISTHTDQYSPQCVPSADDMRVFVDDDLRRLLNQCELPDELSDFILKYSRRYSVDTPPSSVYSASSGGSRKDSAEDGSNRDSPFSSHSMASDSPASVFSDSNSPAPQSSPRGVHQAMNAKQQQMNTARNHQEALNNAATRYKPIKPKQTNMRRGKARERLRSLIGDEEFSTGFAWAVKCWNAGQQAFYFKDQDGDTLLHICMWHKDIPKLYGLVEMMLKDEHPLYGHPFDQRNRLNETPLFLATEKRMEEAVAYLVEVGADPNIRAKNRDGDACLHYAAARGMTEIVSALCTSPDLDINLPNGAGLTPLLCAVKNHGVIEEESQCLVNNKPTIRTLLKHGADPKIAESTPLRKTVLHYAVERMDPELVEIFNDNLDQASMCQLVNMPMYDGNTPLHVLGQMAGSRPSGLTRGEGEEELRRKMFLTLVQCGADMCATNGEGLCPAQPFNT